MGEYTIASNDASHYNKIYAYFEPVSSEMATMTVTGLTTNCCIKVLKSEDFIRIRNINYRFWKDYTQLNHVMFIELLNKATKASNWEFFLDECNRIKVYGDGSGYVIDEASYNVRLLMGLHPFDPFILRSGDLIQTVGFMLSTPVLYLTSNIGMKAYMNNQRSKYTQNSKILMRINNSFSANYPIIASNSEFTTMVASNDLSSVEFTLVDANMVDIELLSPMYLSVSIKLGMIDEKLIGMTKGIASAISWSESMKNNEANKRAAELKAYDIISTMSIDDQSRLMNAHNSK
jgi:hypothetical protein